GAGLPALFAIGLRALSLGATPSGGGGGGGGGEGGPAAPAARNPLGLVIAVICFAVVLAAIGWGIYSIVDHS
ncbi:MAG: hypothetical protein ACRDVE_13675, partial [Actinocrinis sp.]